MRKASVETGLLTVFVRHTSASLLVQENADPDVRVDIEAFFLRLVPSASDPAMSYLTHRTEGSDDMPAHIKSALTQTSFSIPIAGGKMDDILAQGDRVVVLCTESAQRGGRMMLISASLALRSSKRSTQRR